MSGVNEIWNEERNNLPEEQLIAYLEGRLSIEQQRDIERMLSEEGMESDAIEGLKELQTEAATHSVKKLNAQLRQFTHKKKRRTHPFSDNKWTWLAILIVLLLCIMSYTVLHWINR